MAARARRVRPRRANRAPDSPAPAPTTVVDTLFTEGVSPTREGEGGRGEPPEVRGGIGIGVSGATADEPPGFARPTAIARPSGTKRKKSTAQAHNNWVKHGWWITERTYFVGHQYVDSMLHITVDPIDTVSVFSGLGHVYGVLKSISNPRRAGPGTFYITVVPEGASWACRYLLQKDNMMRPVPQGLLDRRPLFPGITPMAQWWANYSDIDREQRLRVTCAVAQMSDEEVKRLKQYMLTRRLADAKIAEFLAQGGAGASTSSAPPVPIPEAVPNPEENDPIYRALAFPVDAPRAGPSRPLRGPHERYLPSDREGRCGRAYAAAMAA